MLPFLPLECFMNCLYRASKGNFDKYSYGGQPGYINGVTIFYICSFIWQISFCLL